MPRPFKYRHVTAVAFDEKLLRRLDEWRLRQRPPLPLAAAVRYLVALGLKNGKRARQWTVSDLQRQNRLRDE